MRVGNRFSIELLVECTKRDSDNWKGKGTFPLSSVKRGDEGYPVVLAHLIIGLVEELPVGVVYEHQNSGFDVFVRLDQSVDIVDQLK